MTNLFVVKSMVLLVGIQLGANAWAAPPLLITHARVWTLDRSRQDLDERLDAQILVTEGKIACVSASQQRCPQPSDAQIYDAQGQIVLPGLIESLARIGQVEVDAEESSHDGVAAKSSNNAQIQAIDGLTLHSRAVEAARQGGVTVSIARPLGAALIAGSSVAFWTRDGPVDEVVVKNALAIHVNLGEEAKQDLAGVGARSGQIALLRTILQQVGRLYSADHGKKPKEAAEKESLERLRDDPAVQALRTALEAGLPLVVHAHHAEDILAVLRLKDLWTPGLMIAGGAEAHAVARQLAKAKVPVLLGPVRVAPYQFALLRADVHAAGVLQRAGVVVALATADTHQARNLRWEAGFAVAAGLDHDAAVAALTRVPANLWHLPPGVGEIRVGTTANLLVFDGDPLTFEGHLRLLLVGESQTRDPKQN